MIGESFIDVDVVQRPKHGQRVLGDVFLSRKIKEEGRLIAVLSDGLGSGVKASVLATMTAAMALRYTAAFVDVRQSAQTIMDTLPICEVRKISYSTFTIVDIDDDGTARFIEHGNPPLLLLRGLREIPLDKHEIRLPHWNDRVITYAETKLQLGDRVVCCSDGITQSGMERPELPMGWGGLALRRAVQMAVAEQAEVASAQLARQLVQQAMANDGHKAKDDLTCAAIYFRRPRRLLVASGPPFVKERDAELAETVRAYPGRKAICGGTTAGIVARLLGRGVEMDLTHLDPDVPPASRMEGVDLVTEGTLTLARAAELLERRVHAGDLRSDAAGRLVRLMLESDLVDFFIGTRINDAHQAPNLPVELDLRRNIIRKIAGLLEGGYLKETSVRFL